MNSMRDMRLRFALTLVTCVSLTAQAQQKPQLPAGYPDKPIRMIVATAPGGGITNLSRAVAQKLSERWGPPVVIDNRGGANGMIAMDLVAQAVPDGYTIMAATQSMIINAVTNKMAYDIRTAYVPLVKMAAYPYILLVHPTSSLNSVKELIAQAKTKPGALSYGSTGMGSLIHFGTELFKSMAGIDAVHIPYKGTGPAYIDLIGGRIHFLISGPGAAPFVKNGRLKAIGTTSLKRQPAYPDLPTFDESGVRGFEMSNSSALYAPSRTLPALVLVLNREVGQIVNSTEMKEKVAADGSEAVALTTPEELRKDFVKEVDKWNNLVKTSRIALE